MKHCFLRFWANFTNQQAILLRKFACGFRNNMTWFLNHVIVFQHLQCVMVLKVHVGLYVESKQHGYVNLIFCLFLFDWTARIDTTEVSTCRGSFDGFKSTCFQLDWAARIKTTKISYRTLVATDHLRSISSRHPWSRESRDHWVPAVIWFWVFLEYF